MVSSRPPLGVSWAGWTHREDDLNASFFFRLPHSATFCPAPDMDLSIHNLPSVFTELSRLSDGDHTIYIRADPHSFLEVHRTGIRNLFSTTVAAFIPDVVIKLQIPLASSIIAAV